MSIAQKIATDILSNPKIFRRPIAITAICILGLLGTILSVPMLFSAIALDVDHWLLLYIVAVTLVNGLCMFGFWKLKRWGLYTYAVLAVVNQLILITIGQWFFGVLLIQTVIVIIVIHHLLSKSRPLFHQIAKYFKKKAWAFIVAYMIGIHNFYREEEKDPEDIVYKIENTQEQEDDQPVD